MANALSYQDQRAMAACWVPLFPGNSDLEGN
jgi:hypothetical protein